MKKFLSLAAVLMLAACSSDEIFVDEAPHASSKGQVPIAVNTYLQGQTKAILTTDAARLQENGFLLLASYNTGAVGSQPTVLINQFIEYDAQSKDWWLWNDDDQDGFFYWPKKQNNVPPTVQFGAILYTPPVVMSNELREEKFKNTNGLIHISPYRDTLNIAIYDDNNEIIEEGFADIVAAHAEATSESNNGVVNLDFNHILAQVTIAATYPNGSKVQERQWSYRLNSIVLTGNVYSNYDVLKGSWQTTGETMEFYHNFAITSPNQNIVYSATGETTNLNWGYDRSDQMNEILVIPGSYKLTVNYNIYECPDAEDYYYDDEGYAHYNASKSYSVSTPDDAPVTLVAGKRNVINIKLPDTDKMEMGVSVGLSNWVDGGNQDPSF